MPPSRCSSSVNQTLKPRLKSPPNEDAHRNVHPIRRLYACSFASGARDTAQSITSWLARCTANPLKPSAINEQAGHPPGVVAFEHEVVDQELRAPSKEVRQRGAPLVGLEAIRLVDSKPTAAAAA